MFCGEPSCTTWTGVVRPQGLPGPGRSPDATSLAARVVGRLAGVERVGEDPHLLPGAIDAECLARRGGLHLGVGLGGARALTGVDPVGLRSGFEPCDRRTADASDHRRQRLGHGLDAGHAGDREQVGGSDGEVDGAVLGVDADDLGSGGTQVVHQCGSYGIGAGGHDDALAVALQAASAAVAEAELGGLCGLRLVREAVREGRKSRRETGVGAASVLRDQSAHSGRDEFGVECVAGFRRSRHGRSDHRHEDRQPDHCVFHP